MNMPDRAELVERARATIARGSQSFATASKIFAPTMRERAWLLYAWCRAADDMTDGQEMGHPTSIAPLSNDSQAKLEALTHSALYDEQPLPTPFAALRQVARETRMPHSFIADHLAGFALDTSGWRPRSEDDLLQYCYHVAGVVGCMMAIVMGVDPEDEDTLNRACDLGLAFQLSNIARDLVPDAKAGRCYIPADWLAQTGLNEATLAQEANRDKLASIAARLVLLARPYRASARVGAARLITRARLAVLAADAIYGAIGEIVLRKGARAWDRRAQTGKLSKIVLFAGAAVRSCTPPARSSREGLWTRST